MTRFIAAGVVDNVQDVKSAIDRLRDLAFKQICVLALDENVRKELPYELLADGEMEHAMKRAEIPQAEISFLQSELQAGRILLTVMTAVGFNAADGIIRECKGRSQPPAT